MPGQPTAASPAPSDATVIHHLQQRIAQQEHALTMLCDLVLWLDGYGIIQHAHYATPHLHHDAGPTPIYHPITDYILDWQPADFVQHWQAVQQAPVQFTATYQITPTEAVPVGIMALPLMAPPAVPVPASPTPEPPRLCWIIRDLRLNQQVYADLQQLQQVYADLEQRCIAFAANVNHAMRTPISTITGLISLLHDTRLDSTQHNYVTMIAQSSATLHAIIADLFDLVQIESGAITIAAEPFAPRTLLADVCQPYMAQVQARGLSLTATVDALVPELLVGDEIQIRRILVNLIDNAVKVTEAGTIHVTVTCQCPYYPCLPVPDTMPAPHCTLQLAVADTGRGIDPSLQAQMFEPFVQAQIAPQATPQGTGIGLAITKALVQAMGGEIAVENQPQVGTTFSIALPVVGSTVSQHAAATSQTAPEPTTPDAVALYILIVEDNPLNAQVLQYLLARMGYPASIASSGQEALDLLQHEPYNLLLLDIQMPGLDGLEVTRQIRQRAPDATTPQIVAVTAYALAGARQQLLEAGFNDYIEKPISSERLQQALAAATARIVSGVDRTRPDPSSALYAPLVAPVAAATHAESLPILDATVLHDLMDVLGTGGDDLRNVVALYQDDIQQRLQALDRLLALHQYGAAQRETHALVSLAAQIGAVRLAALCEQLEDRLREAPTTALALLEAAHTAFAQACTMLHDLPGGEQ
ncbi:MAG: response regulator [Chloroflexaceae bacterium]|nr:response regulator [Chloroflexaceae bacterium]